MNHRLIAILMCTVLANGERLLANGITGVSGERLAVSGEAERVEVREVVYATEETEEMRATPDSLVRVEITTISYYTDTLRSWAYVQDSVPQQRVDTIHADSLDRRGHYVEAHVGLGYGGLGYGLRVTGDGLGVTGDGLRVTGSFSGQMQVQYAYFFHQNWGVGGGLWFTNYTSVAKLPGVYVWEDVSSPAPASDEPTPCGYSAARGPYPSHLPIHTRPAASPHSCSS